MKLRLFDDSIRIRIQQKELAELHGSGRIEASTVFGSSQRLGYSLEVGDIPTPLRAEVSGSSISVLISKNAVDELARTDLVGVSCEQPAGSGHTLHILIEKDFKCLTPRAGEEDAFPNPNEAC